MAWAPDMTVPLMTAVLWHLFRVFAWPQIRGSIPLYWTQYVTMRYMPRVKKTGTAEEVR